MKTNRALIIGVESYKDPLIGRRPGTIKALREVDLRLRQGGWETRFLQDGATILHERPGLTQILDSFEWLKESGQALVVISSTFEEGRLLPFDTKSQFKMQSSLELAELVKALPPNSGLIIDGAVQEGELEGADWLLSAGPSPHALFSEFGPTKFLHAVVISLNECPLDKPLSVRTFFEAVEKNDAPSVIFQDYQSVESVSILTPPPARTGEEDTAEHQAIDPDQSLHGGRYLDSGRYQLLRVLGEGGIGQVYLAHDEQLGVKRAIKLLKIPDSITDEQRQQIRGRMTQAALAAQTLSERSHHVVRVFDIKTDHNTGLPFTVMEFLSGETLSHRLYHRPLTLDQVFEIGLTLVETMAVAHELKLIHRDLKPENVMLIDRGGSDLFVKLLDFDLVKFDPSEAQVQTQEGQILGTLEYMSPEQLKGQTVDERADVFSLGAILYECFSGVRANPGRSQRELIKTLLDSGVTPLKSVSPKLPDALCALIDRCLSLSLEARPAHAGELLRELSALQDVKPHLSLMTFSAPRFSPHETITPDTITPEPLNVSVPAGESAYNLPIDHEAATLAPHQSSEPRGAVIEVEGAIVEPRGQALNEQATELVGPGHRQGSSVREEQGRSVLLWALIGVILTLLVTWLFKANPRDEAQGLEEPTAATAQVTAPPQATPPPARAEPKELTQLHLLELASPSFAEVHVQHEGSQRRYTGGRLSQQLALFVYEAHFQHLAGDPPRAEWAQAEALRWALTKRVERLKLSRDPKGLIIDQADFERLLSARPPLKSDPKLGEHLVSPEGLLLLGKQSLCKGLEAGDTITELSWKVRGRARLNGSCEGASCAEKIARAHKSAKRYREPLRLTVSYTRWPLEQRAALNPEEGRLTRCVLK